MKKIITICVLALLIVPVLTVTATDNQPPNAPTITGETNGKMGTEYEYTFTTIDPDGDDVYYKISWGNGEIIYWTGPYKSGEEVTFEHAWSALDRPSDGFTICAVAKDVNDARSEVGTLEIYMTLNKELSTINSLFLQFLEILIERFPMLQYFLDF